MLKTMSLVTVHYTGGHPVLARRYGKSLYMQLVADRTVERDARLGLNAVQGVQGTLPTLQQHTPAL
jgi:hypothetical protein